jgi:SNF2 family DNA or RNA helicase
MLISILTSLSEDAKAIVFHEYNYSGKRICDALTKVSIPHLYLYGKTKNAQSVREQFERNPNYRVLVLSNAAGWAGINLQVANYGLYYESPVSVIMRRQTRARFVRQESAHQRVFLYDLVTKDTLDEKILLFHKQGQSLFDALVEGRISLAG